MNYKLSLTRKNYKVELAEKVEAGLISAGLASALIALIQRMTSKEGIWDVRIPVLTDDIVSSIMDDTDDGKFMINGQVFELYAQVAEGLPSYVSMSHLRSTNHSVIPVSLLSALV